MAIKQYFTYVVILNAVGDVVGESSALHSVNLDVPASAVYQKCRKKALQEYFQGRGEGTTEVKKVRPIVRQFNQV